MENQTSDVEKLIGKVETYAKTSFDLGKYKTVYVSADIFSAFAVRLAITTTIILVSLLVNIGLALWIGQELGESYYGFFVIAAFYLLLTLILYVFRKQWIRKPVSDFIISRILKDELT